jgi:hypothetical protein
MKLSDIEGKGGFVDGQLVKKSGVWKRFDEEKGEFEDFEIEFFVKQSSWYEYQKILKPDGDLHPEALAIAACIRLGDDGSEQMTYEQVTTLDSGLFNAFRIGLAEVYSAKKK